MLIGLDLDGVLCDLGAALSSRISERFGVVTHPATWRSYDLRLLSFGLPEARFHNFLDETFADPCLYRDAPPAEGAPRAVAHLLDAGWRAVGITARPAHLAEVTRLWLAAHEIALETVHHTAVGAKSDVARALGVDVTVEDNPSEAELLAGVCESWLLDRPYNRRYHLERAGRLLSWDDLMTRLVPILPRGAAAAGSSDDLGA